MNLIDEDKLADRMFPRMDSGDLTKAYRTGWNEAIHSIIESEPVVEAIPVAFLDMIRGDITRHDYYTISYAITTIIKEWRTYVCNQRE